MKSVFFIPVYNQLLEFPRVLDELASIPLPCDEILLVNNGSDDGSEELVRASRYPYLDVPKNRGVGYSYRLAIEWALTEGYDVLGTMASNGKMLPAEMERLLEPILADRVDYASGSRFLAGGNSPNLPRFRQASIPMVNHFARVLTGARLTDATCGFRALRTEMMRRARFDWHAVWLDGYAFEYYLYAKVLLDREIRSQEVPVTMRYPPGGQRYSKIPPITGWYEMLKPWVVARFDGKGFAPRGEDTVSAS